MAEEEAARATRVQESYRQLSVAATTLNTASDALSKSISDLDAVLRKLGLGVSAWIPFREERPVDTTLARYETDEIGYAKSGGKWCLSIRTGLRSGQIGLGDDVFEQWPFNEAPRALRVRAVTKIPDLLDQLNKDAIAAAKNIADKAAEVDQLTVAMVAIAADDTPPLPVSPISARPSGWKR